MWNHVIAQRAVELGFVEPTKRIILHGPGLPADELQDISGRLSRLLGLLCSLLSRKFYGDHGAMARALRFCDEEVEIFSRLREPLEIVVLARGDLVRSNGQWRLHELNIGSNVAGGMPIASLPRLAGISQEGDVLDGWAQAITTRWEIGKHFAFVVDSQYLTLWHKAFESFAKEITKLRPVEISILGHREVCVRNGILCAPNGVPITFVYRQFNEHDIRAAPNEYDELLYAITTKRVLCPMGPSYNLAGCKGALALVWELLRTGELNAQDEALVRALVPHTIWVSEQTAGFIVENQQDYVIKPLNLFQSIDVVAGREVGYDEWRLKIDHIVSGQTNHAFVAQEFAGGETAELTLVREGDIVREHSEVSWGIYVFGDVPLGGFIRGKPLDGPVIHRGPDTSAGPIPIVQSVGSTRMVSMTRNP